MAITDEQAHLVSSTLCGLALQSNALHESIANLAKAIDTLGGAPGGWLEEALEAAAVTTRSLDQSVKQWGWIVQADKKED